jgi:hypothetical protein
MLVVYLIIPLRLAAFLYSRIANYLVHQCQTYLLKI